MVWNGFVLAHRRWYRNRQRPTLGHRMCFKRTGSSVAPFSAIAAIARWWFARTQLQFVSIFSRRLIVYVLPASKFWQSSVRAAMQIVKKGGGVCRISDRSRSIERQNVRLHFTVVWNLFSSIIHFTKLWTIFLKIACSLSLKYTNARFWRPGLACEWWSWTLPYVSYRTIPIMHRNVKVPFKNRMRPKNKTAQKLKKKAKRR